ncbi:MAG TPA: cold shock domain-containing protein [Candidatus Eisenbacteria bacterium]|nr:cold shock domain-containing protein [Candidatus Eisenbacteria bacterium]
MRREAPLPETASLTGTVSWFSEPRGYGFIALPSGPPVYVHHSVIEMDGFRTLRPGMQVHLEVDEGPAGPRARRVVLGDRA